ncbi:MAG: hisZ [Betaproteobacteria bacterium]|nr:hisZ [Betaproteobacteria bacterium]
MHKWLLPEYIEDVLPEPARRIEALRRGMLDLFALHGYQFVVPPMLEYVDSLLTGTGHDLDLRTFKLVDQLSGRTLGIRADITPQVARIDAHLMNRKGVNRLCYAGSVLHTLPAGLNRTREPLQIGAEIYGHAGIESDLEVQRLMLDALRLAGVSKLQLDIGHVAVFHSLVRAARVGADVEAELFRAVQAKDVPALSKLVRKLDRDLGAALLALPELAGGVDVLARAKKLLPDNAEIKQALAQLRAIAASIQDAGTEICFDLGELRGLHYHSGVVFAVYAEGWSNALALGGRYDEVGEAFGRARPATGFSMDLREIIAAAPAADSRNSILAPYLPADAALQRRISTLRKSGDAVIVDLPGHDKVRDELGCNRRLARRNGKWIVEPL